MLIKSDDEKKRLLRIASEALLIFGGNYDGDKKENGYNTVNMDGCILTKSDFGYL